MQKQIDVPREDLVLAAVELRLAGVDARMVDYYLHCGDNSVRSMLEWLERDPSDFRSRIKRHVAYLEEVGKIK